MITLIVTRMVPGARPTFSASISYNGSAISANLHLKDALAGSKMFASTDLSTFLRCCISGLCAAFDCAMAENEQSFASSRIDGEFHA